MLDSNNKLSNEKSSNYLEAKNSNLSFTSRPNTVGPSNAFSSGNQREDINSRNSVSRFSTPAPASRNDTFSLRAISNSLKTDVALTSSSASPFVDLGFDLDFSQKNESNKKYITQIERPQSAAPPVSRPPPGMESTFSSSPSHNFSINYQSFTEEALKRPASTGVIGDSSNVRNSSFLGSLGGLGSTSSTHSNDNGPSSITSRKDVGPNTNSFGGPTIRPAPKTLMELIQEDCPKTPSPSFLSYPELERCRPKSTSPRKTPAFKDVSEGTRKSNEGISSQVSKEVESYSQRNHDAVRRQIHDTFGRKILYQNEEAPTSGRIPNTSVENPRMNETTPYISIPVSQLQHQSLPGQLHHPTSNQAIYSTNATSLQHMQPQVNHQPPPYEIQTVYYSNQQHPDNPSSTEQILHHHPTMYVNSPAAPYYAVRYAGHPSTHIHHTIQNPQIHAHHPPPQHEYVSIVPIHHHPHITTVSSNGSYTYWHNSQGNSQPSIVNNVGGSLQITSPAGPHSQILNTPQTASIIPLGNNNSSPINMSRHQQRVKSGGKNAGDKSKNRKNNRRSAGGESSPSKHNRGSAVNSQILDDFRNSKNRSWTVADILGKYFHNSVINIV